jgi:hypothetical protein
MVDDNRSMWSAGAIACLLFGLASFALAVPFFLTQYKVVSQWPEVQAHVHKSEVVEVTREGVKLYATRFELSFVTGDQLHVVTVNAYRQGSDASIVKAEADRFPYGSTVVVRYNPKNPSDIRLDTDHPRRFFQIPIALGITGLIFVISSIIVFFLLRF